MDTSSFATPNDMEARSQGAIPASRPFLQKALDAATTRIRNHCGWHIAEVEQTELDLSGFFGRFIFLPTLRLVSLDELVIDGSTIDLTPETPSWEWTQDGLCGPWWESRFHVASAKITHGFDTVPADLVDLTLELATGELQSAGGAIREQTLASSVTWARASGRLVTDDKDSLAAYKIGYTP